jgi:ketosteroid isomerase-like protein
MADLDEQRDAVLAVNDAFYRAFNQRDMALMAEVWATEEPVSCIHPGWNVIQGRETVLESWRAILGNPEQPRIVTGGATVSFVGPVAIVIGRELVAGAPLVSTNLYVLEGDRWRLRNHQSGPVQA